MIKGIIIVNNHGKPRLVKLFHPYVSLPPPLPLLSPSTPLLWSRTPEEVMEEIRENPVRMDCWE